MKKQGFIRIIAGKWRGRRLQVPDIKDLRPTPDRVRETLFNWLSPIIAGANCLDLFAGSGVLGFEALSRGAAYVEMVDMSAEVVKLLKEELATFGSDNVRIYRAQVPAQLQPATKKFAIVFLDPPYQENLLFKTCEYLEQNHFLADEAYIYLEAGQPIKDNELPANWRLKKTQRAGQVYYHLAYRSVKVPE